MTEIYLLIVALILVGLNIVILFSKDFIEKLILIAIFGNIVILFISLLASFDYYRYYVDIAIIYSFLGYIAFKFIFKYLEFRQNDQQTKFFEE